MPREFRLPAQDSFTPNSAAIDARLAGEKELVACSNKLAISLVFSLHIANSQPGRSSEA